jgi:hypothetical protein
MEGAHPRFERAFVAISYLLGSGAPRDLEELGPDALSLARSLAGGTRETRAAALAREVARITLALDHGSFA